jgi:GPI ethanolamine phosphate transferase 3 subunit O
VFGSEAVDKQRLFVMFKKELALLVWVFFVHLIAITLFTRGFLLTRLSLSDISDCSTRPCTLPPTHTRTILLIIDALRFDFLAPHPPNPHSPFHHNILTLPRELTRLHPNHSLLLNAYVDPPTTTLQRIKGLTTGSLPSFVEIGSNFGGSSVAEDSILNQLRRAGKRVSVSSSLPATSMFMKKEARLRSWEMIHG